MDEMWFWPLAVVAAMLVGMGKGGVPVVAMLAVPLLSLAISPVAAAGLLLPVYVVSDIFGLYAYRAAFERRLVLVMGAGATVGIGVGWATAHLVPEWAVTALVGLIGVVFALNLLLRHGLPEGPPRRGAVGPGLFWGAVTGFTSFVSHAGAPPFQVHVQPLRLSKAVYAGTTTVLFAYVNAVKLVPYWALGQLNLQSLGQAAVLALPAAVSVFLGLRLTQALPERLFFQLVTWALLLISLRLLWQAAAAA